MRTAQLCIALALAVVVGVAHADKKPRSCPVSAWSDWSTCAFENGATCGSGVSTRTRQLLPTTNACTAPSLTDTKRCREECVECETSSWSEWSTCVFPDGAVCGHGVSTRSRELVFVNGCVAPERTPRLQQRRSCELVSVCSRAFARVYACTGHVAARCGAIVTLMGVMHAGAVVMVTLRVGVTSGVVIVLCVLTGRSVAEVGIAVDADDDVCMCVCVPDTGVRGRQRGR